MFFKNVFFLMCVGSLFIIKEIKGDTNKWCTVRDRTVKREIWNQWTGFWCYKYSNDIRLNYKYNFTMIHYSIDTKVPGTRFNNTEFWYDYLNETSLHFIKKSFKNDNFFQLWKSCCQEAVDCCDNFMNGENILPNEEYPCPAIWDGWSCFGPAKANTVEKVKCSRQAYSTESDVCELQSEKECFKNGTWNQNTDYNVCSIAPVLRNRHKFNVIILAVAIVICFPAVVIFFSFRNFRTKIRYILHRNLILIIIIRNILSIMTKEIVILDAIKSPKESNLIMISNGVACRVLAFFENAAKNGMFACMLADGFYLHKLIVRSFADEPTMIHIYIAVSVLSFLPSLIWATARGIHEGSQCWMIDETQDQWISDGFRIVILAINLLLLLDIIRVMTMKLKHSGTSQHTKATLRATLFLIPLFGVHIIIITNRNIVPSNTCEAQDIYYYISYSIEGLQGIMVSFLFCYLSTEVIGELKNAIRKITLYLQLRFGDDFNKNKNNRRRTTAATFVDPF